MIRESASAVGAMKLEACESNGEHSSPPLCMCGLGAYFSVL